MIVARVVSAVVDRTDVRLNFFCLSEHFFDLELSQRCRQSTNTDCVPFVCSFSPALIYVRSIAAVDLRSLRL